MPRRLSDPIIMTVKRAGDVRIHTFVASFAGDNIANATHIIETRNALVLIDGQFLVPYAQQFREYADGLGKPIDRLYLSHRHPDHWFGLGAAFSDVRVHALSETVDFIREHGEEARQDHLKKMGDLAPRSIPVGLEVATPGELTVDGVRFRLGRVVDTEIDFLLTVELPDIGVNIVQDLIYSGTHLYLTKDMEHWIRVLGRLLRSDGELFMPGHGLPADRNEVARNIEYLSSARLAMQQGMSSYAFRDFLIQRYPDRKCPAIFDIYLPRLFDGASQF